MPASNYIGMRLKRPKYLLLTVGTLAIASLIIATQMRNSRGSSSLLIPQPVHNVIVSGIARSIREGQNVVSIHVPSESEGEIVLELQDAYVLERGMVGRLDGILFDVSGGCCLDDAKTYERGDTIEAVDQPAAKSRSIFALASTRKTAESIYILEHWHSETYYHFLIEALPRLEHLWTRIYSNKDIKIFQTSVFAEEAFALLGLGHNRVYNQRNTIIPTVLLPPPTLDPRGDAGVWRLKRVVQRLLKGAKVAHEGPSLKPTWVVINRKGAHQRIILNHDELMAGLRKAYPSVEFKEFAEGSPPADAVAEQGGSIRATQNSRHGLLQSIRAFRTCWGVIAPHGAGLSNMVFIANEGAAVVEIVGESQTGRVYGELAQQFGLQYSEISSPIVMWEGHHMRVDVPGVVHAVQEHFVSPL